MLKLRFEIHNVTLLASRFYAMLVGCSGLRFKSLQVKV